MNTLELMRTRRSIRRYRPEQMPRAALEAIIEAGLYAPSAGGGQRTYIAAIRDAKTLERVGRWNAERMDRSRLAGGHVSADQPSLIDDAAIQSGFYGAPTVCALFGPENFLYSVPDAFCCAENMALMAWELGISSCIVARGEETFAGGEGAALLKAWGVPEGYIARCFVLLGEHDGPYPAAKPRRPGRWTIIEQEG